MFELVKAIMYTGNTGKHSGHCKKEGRKAAYILSLLRRPRPSPKSLPLLHSPRPSRSLPLLCRLRPSSKSLPLFTGLLPFPDPSLLPQATPLTRAPPPLTRLFPLPRRLLPRAAFAAMATYEIFLWVSVHIFNDEMTIYLMK